MNNVKTLKDSSLVKGERLADIHILLIACGYERRSTFFYRKLRKLKCDILDKVLVYGFPNFKNAGSRTYNDNLILEDGYDQISVDGHDKIAAVGNIHGLVSKYTEGGKSVHLTIDYSSMPRNWYCCLARAALTGELDCEVEFVYVSAELGAKQYPCVGNGDFTIFAGDARITTTLQFHVFGLGFDSIRTHGIWNYLDPYYTTCLIAQTPNNQDAIDRVKKENHEILRNSDKNLQVPINDFRKLVASIVDTIRDYIVSGDVSLVPDGPKPLILAMSIAPMFFGLPGAYSWHVAHAKPEGYSPIDVEGVDCIYCFKIEDDR